MSARQLEFVVRGSLALAALIHLLPLPGVLGASLLQSTYGLGEIDATVVLLLQHRALVFALMAALLLAAVYQTALRTAAISLVMLSDLGFLALCLAATELKAELLRVAIADIISVLALTLAACLQYLLRAEPGKA